RDFKPAYDGDEGPNTGGMGCISPLPDLDAELIEQILATVHRPVVYEMPRRGAPFRGCLYAGLMLTADGPRVLEFNTRFGDPEAQVILPRLRGDLLAGAGGPRPPPARRPAGGARRLRRRLAGRHRARGRRGRGGVGRDRRPRLSR